METDFEGLIETAKANTAELVHGVEMHETLSAFLSDEDLRLSIHSTRTLQLEQEVFLDYWFDIDGVVAELRSLTAIKSPIHYLFFNVQGLLSLKSIYHDIKKHVDITYYTEQGLKCLQNMQALHIAYTQGYRISITLIPEIETGCASFKNLDSAKQISLDFFKRFNENFLNQLRHLSSSNMQRPTMRKNTLYDTSRMNVLHQDQEYVLSLLDVALTQTERPPPLRVLLVATQFGQKQTDALVLSQLFHMPAIRSLSVHTACNIDAQNYNTHLLWSRQGIQEVIGSRGRLFSCLSLTEAANFQTNLDGRKIDISRDLKRVSKFPEHVTFLQLYADTPHLKLQPSYPHPVSGAIASCGLMHPQISRAMLRRSRDYILHMEDIGTKLQGIIPCRLEIVTKLRTELLLDEMHASTLFDELAISDLLQHHPMLVPFYEYESEMESFGGIMRSIALHICSELTQNQEHHIFKGGFLPSWRSFQMELAIELFIWGQPMLRSDNIFARNLGPDTQAERSLTSMRGILGLAPPNSASLPDSPPPVFNWASPEQRMRIKRIFCFADCLQAGDIVIGRNLVTIVLLDLYDRDTLALHGLKDTRVPFGGRCVGSISPDQLVTELENANRFLYPHTFGRALTLLQESDIPVRRTLNAGITEIGLRFFPAIKVIDQTRHAKATWNKRDFWEIVLPDQSPSTAAQAASLTADVMVNLESKKLVYGRTLQPFKDSAMPWMEPVVRRLQHLNLPHRQLVETCTFITCVAFLQLGIYVDYYALSEVERTLPLPQRRLRDIEIQSHLLLSGSNRPKLWRLHERIPCKIQLQKNRPTCPRQWHQPSEIGQSTTIPDPQTEEVAKQNVVKLDVRNLPANWKRPWSSMELDMVHQAILSTDGTYRVLFQCYTRLCREQGQPVRTFQAFKTKALKLKKCDKG